MKIFQNIFRHFAFIKTYFLINYDGSTYLEDTYEDEIPLPDTIPTRASTAQYDFTFLCWSRSPYENIPLLLSEQENEDIFLILHLDRED